METAYLVMYELPVGRVRVKSTIALHGKACPVGTPKARQVDLNTSVLLEGLGSNKPRGPEFCSRVCLNWDCKSALTVISTINKEPCISSSCMVNPLRSVPGMVPI
jgi:hypothetical protein